MGALRKIRNALALVRPCQVAFARTRCEQCGPTVLLKLADDAISVRCIRCGASAIHLSIMRALGRLYADMSAMSVYEMSSRGPLCEYLKRRAGQLAVSEYYDDVAPGHYKGGIQCQDVTRLTFADGVFDLCTSTEVFEHVPDDRRGFRELRRVLRAGGKLVFTVPLTDSESTVERATIADGKLRHLLPPEYHGDAIRGQGKVLAFRNYGRDIIDRLRSAGFEKAGLVYPDRDALWGLGVAVVVAEK